MENWITQSLSVTFLKYYGLQMALKSEDKMVVREAIDTLSKFTSLRVDFILKNLKEISTM